jgi:hypothetical protein
MTHNPLWDYAEKQHSMYGEDGIIAEIFRRINLGRLPDFFEMGVGDGYENNTLNLLYGGSRGAWAEGQDVNQVFLDPPYSDRLKFIKSWITADNASQLYQDGFDGLHEDLFSIDLDGNDLHVISKIMEGGANPLVIVLEYNGRFPPPVRFTVAYDPQHRWDFTDYFGASLTCFNNLLASYGYTCIGCIREASNAFFVRNGLMGLFSDVPKTLEELFVLADYDYPEWGHQTSPKTTIQLIKMNTIEVASRAYRNSVRGTKVLTAVKDFWKLQQSQ